MSLTPDSSGSPWAPPGSALPPPPGTAAPVPPAAPPAGTMSGPASAWGEPPMVPVTQGTGDGSGGPRRSRGKLIGGLVGVGALVAAGTFAVVSITGNDEQGGAASPEEVVTSLAEAVDNEDVLGMIDLLLPGERDTFREPLITFFDHLRRLEVLSDDASLDKLGGVDFQVTIDDVQVEPTNVDDIANVVASGTSSVTVNGDEVPLGDLLIDQAFGGDRPDMDADEDATSFDDDRFTVVQEDGRWYLSAFYSIAEQARGDQDIPTEGVAPAGADSPDGAVAALLDDVSDLDLEGIIADLDPTEMGALQRYAPLFLDDAQQSIDDVGIEWGIENVEYSVEGSGARRSVGIDHLEFRAADPTDSDAGDVSLVYDDGCFEVTLFDESERACPGDLGSLNEAIDSLGEGADDAEVQALRDLADAYERAFADYDPTGIAVHEVDGRWFVSPLRSMADGLDATLSALDADELSELIDAARTAFEDTVGSIDIDDPLDGLDVGLDDSSDDTVDESVGEPSDDTVDTSDESFDALTACYSEADAAAGVQCFQDGIADGTIDPSYVSAPIRHPECGVAEAYFGGLFSLTDDEFTTLVTGASPCFLKLVESGELASYEVPDELIAPECVEGRNWYAVFDDEAYNERVFDCAAKVRGQLP